MIKLFRTQFFPVVFQRLNEQKLFSLSAAYGTSFFFFLVRNSWLKPVEILFLYHLFLSCKETSVWEERDLHAGVMWCELVMKLRFICFPSHHNSSFEWKSLVINEWTVRYSWVLCSRSPWRKKENETLLLQSLRKMTWQNIWDFWKFLSALFFRQHNGSEL